jgi:uncharacterized protein YaaQ
MNFLEEGAFIMKLVIAVIQDSDAGRLIENLTEKNSV